MAFQDWLDVTALELLPGGNLVPSVLSQATKLYPVLENPDIEVKLESWIRGRY